MRDTVCACFSSVFKAECLWVGIIPLVTDDTKDGGGKGRGNPAAEHLPAPVDFFLIEGSYFWLFCHFPWTEVLVS